MLVYENWLKKKLGMLKRLEVCEEVWARKNGRA